MTHHSHTGHRSRTAAVAASVGATLALVCVVAVPPVLLAALIGDPLPHQLPTANALSAWLRSPLSDRAALEVIAVLAWATWLHFCGCLIVEFARQARGRSWQIPLGGANQRLAAHLVAAVLIAGPTVLTSAHGYGAGLTPAAAAVPSATSLVEAPILSAVSVATRVPDGTTIHRHHDEAAADRSKAAGYKEYVVAPPHGRHHDTLWDIAKRHLGDPLRWPEIFALNDGRHMPDGRQMTRASLILPGWVLRMPPDATGLPDLTTNGGDRAPATDTRDPAGHRPPHHEVHADPLGVAHRALGPHQPVQRHLQVAPPPSQVAQPQMVPRPDRPNAAETSTVRATPHVSSTPGHADLDPAVPIGAGLSLAAIGLLAALQRRRRITARRRAPGTRLAPPSPELLATEARLRREARDAGVVAATIRLAVALAAHRDPDLAVCAAFHHADGTVELVLDLTRPAPEPFTSTGRGWRLARLDQDYLFAVGTHSDPMPLLVPVGLTGDAVCYLNLEAGGPVAIDGDGADVDAVIAGLIGALAAAPWAQELTRVVVPSRLARTTSGLDRIEVLTDDPTTAFAHLTRYAATVNDTLASSSLAQARRSGTDDAIGMIVLAGFAPEQIPTELRAAAATPTSPVVVLLAGPDPDATVWGLHGGRLTIPGIGEIAEPPRVEPDDADRNAELLAQALDPTPAPPEDPVYAEVDANCPPEPHQQPIEVLVLGPVALSGTEDLRRARVLAVIVFLAMHRHPVSPQRLFAALWPDREYAGHVLRARVSDARTLLDGGIIRRNQGWQLADSIGCDWQRFQALAVGDHTDQLAALELVRGQPFEGFDADWLHVDGYLHTIEAAIVDLALVVGERALEAGDPVEASAAATAGLRATPYDERLYQLATRAAAARGATAEVTSLRNQYHRAVEDDLDSDDQVEPDAGMAHRTLGRDRATG